MSGTVPIGIVLMIMIYGYGCLIAGFLLGWQFRDMRRTP